MTIDGMVFMFVAWGFIIALCALCFRTIFRVHATKNLVAPLEIDTELPESTQNSGQ